MDTVSKPMYGWNDLPWKQFERQVFKLQKRIYRASQRGDVKTVHKLQRLLMQSRASRYLAVRRVTQDNQGKKTAGVDGVKALGPRQRIELAESLTLNQKASPVRRVWIPKPGTTEKRGLGIPTMANRALQALVKLALEPQWEARFEPNSYGFRPGRSTHDALEAIPLLAKLATFPTLRRVMKSWLKAGIMEGVTLTPTEEGCPQGAVISPLLANVAGRLFGRISTVASKRP